MGFLQALYNTNDEREIRNWTSWLIYYIAKLSACDVGHNRNSLALGKPAERKLLNVRVQLSYGPFIQVLPPLMYFLFFFLLIDLFLLIVLFYLFIYFFYPCFQIMFEPSATVKEMFKTVVSRSHLKNTGMYYLYLVDDTTGKQRN